VQAGPDAHCHRVSVAFAVFAIVIFVRNRSGLQVPAVIYALNAVVSAFSGPLNTFVRPRRIRRNAQRLIWRSVPHAANVTVSSPGLICTPAGVALPGRE
jgi:hypothetical protein